jgi:SurA N-terminal domain
MRPALALGLVLSGLLLAGCGGGGGKAVAKVDGMKVTRDELDATVAHFDEEARREGRPFPKEGSPGFDALRNRLLALLVYRAELELEAKRLGVRVTDAQVARRLELPNAGEEGEGADAFARGTVRSQLLYEGIFRRVTRGIRGRSPEAAARRNERMRRFVARMTGRHRVRYEPGYAPGS